jgi:hypothetical protein
MIKPSISLLLIMSLGGCTTFESHRALGPNATIEGLRIPDQKPLLVVSNGVVSTIMVPNADRASAINFRTFLAKNDVTMKFSNGVLTELTNNQDSTAALQTITEAIKNVDKIAAAFSAKDQGGFQVYDIVFDGNGNISRLQPLVHAADLIAVPQANGAGAGTSIEDINRNDAAATAAPPAPCKPGKKKQPDGSCK